MNKKYSSLLSFLLFIAIIGQSQSSINFMDIPVAELRNQAQEEQKLYIVYLHADWCLPCKWMEENAFRAMKVVHYTTQHYLALSLDVNNKQGKYYQKKWEATILPTLLIFAPQGIELARKESSLDEEQLFDFLKSVYKKWKASASPNTASTDTDIMDSPKPILVVSRPALQTEQPQKNTRLSPSKTTKSRIKPGENKKRHPVVSFSPTAKPKVFTPRSGKYYSISLGIFDDYEKALEIVEKYDNKYGERVDMIPITKGSNTTKYQVVSGHFALRSAAAKHLNYLNRNDIMGQIIQSGQ